MFYLLGLRMFTCIDVKIGTTHSLLVADVHKPIGANRLVARGPR